MLHARELSFIHPRTEEQMSFEAPLPADFREALKFLRA
jgi:23S rRNA pseudouridine1911/1915/1917 synthase